MEWKEIYKSKHISVNEAAAQIKSGDRIWCGPGTAMPIQIIEAIANRVDELEDVDIVTTTSLYPLKCIQSAKYIGRINYHAMFYGPYERAAMVHGNININSVHFSQVQNTVRKYYQTNIMAINVSEPDDEGFMYYGPSGVAFNGTPADYDKTIVQVNKYQIKVRNAIEHRIHVSEVDCICECNHELPEFPQPEVTEIDKRIAENIIPYISDESTIQLGIGGLANAIGYLLEEKKNLSIHTEMFTDSMMHLARLGVITGKMVAGFAMGSSALYKYMEEGKVELKPVRITNDQNVIAKQHKFVSINGTLMVDLTGQACSESIGFKQYSSTGGQLDFVRGAALAKDGKSFLCLPSTIETKDGQKKSTITAVLPPGAIVTTPRSEVMYIATEYGVADLFSKPIKVRVNSLIKIAHPSFRDDLRRQATEFGLITQ